MARNYGHLTSGKKLLSLLRSASSQKEKPWISSIIFLLDETINLSEMNLAITVNILNIDGIWFYHKDRSICFMHLRKKHILLHCGKEFILFDKGDKLFGKDQRHKGSWPRMWKLNEQRHLTSLIEFMRSLEVVQEHQLDRDRHCIPRWVKELVKERDGGACRTCGEKNDLHFDHVYPVAWGGGNDPKNIQLLCQKHNSEKSASLKH